MMGARLRLPYRSYRQSLARYADMGDKGCGFGLLLGDVVSVLRNTHRHKGCGWLASWRGSKYENNNTSSQRMWLAYK